MERLIQFLQKVQQGLSEDPLDPLDIADVIWLATQLNQKQSFQAKLKTTPVEVDVSLENEDILAVPSENVRDEVLPPSASTSTPSPELGPQDSSPKPDIPVVPSEGEAVQPGKRLPFRVPVAKAILQRRQISRSLYVLNRKVPSPIDKQLDVAATINQISEEELCIPIYKPAAQRWLDVALVIEQSTSYGIWSQSINEFHQILVRQGAFRDVRRWYAYPDSKKGLILKSLHGNIRNPKELISPRADRLILVLSDCVSNAWYDTHFPSVADIEVNNHDSKRKESEPIPFSWFDWLSLWRLHHPVTIVQMLPPSLWRRTALQSMDEIWLSSNQLGALNHQWQRESTMPWEEEDLSGIPVPIVTFDQHSLKVWAKGVAGVSQTQLSGISFKAISKPSKVSANENNLFELFMEYSSPIARRLAALMSVVPIQLPIIRLVQKNLLFQESNAVHVAELFFSGILRPIDTESNPEKRLYDFVGDLRTRLNRTISEREAASVIDYVSRDIMRRAGIDSVRDFRAFLVAPMAQDSNALTSEISEFARISLDVLRRLGGEYAKFVENLEASNRERQESRWPPLVDFDSQTPIISSEQTINLPSIETQMVEVATISYELLLDHFQFSVATLVQESRWIFGPRWVIKKRKSMASVYQEVLSDDISLEMVYIPGGKFMMGSSGDASASNDNEMPQHQAKIPEFYMGRYPVTQSQWRAIAVLPQEKHNLELNPSVHNGEDLPVENVSWNDAVEFCLRLSRLTGKKYRLPSEAEWEYACRASTTTAFSFGDMITTDVANYSGREFNDGPKGKMRSTTTPVSKFGIANSFGLSDMHGNVWEWCKDVFHRDYDGAPKDGSAWLEGGNGSTRVLRGGAWDYVPANCRSAYRNYGNPDYHVGIIGFRVVCGVRVTP